MTSLSTSDYIVKPYDSADYLKTPEDISEYLSIVFADGDPNLIARALGNVARAKGMSKVAKSVNMDRSGLYRALSPDGEPKFSTISKVVNTLGYQLSIIPKTPVHKVT